MSSNHPLANEMHLEPAQFSDQTLILYTGDSHAIMDEVLIPAAVAPARLIQVRITEAIVELARSGQGIAIIAGWAFQDMQDSDNLTAVRISEKGFRRTWRAIVNERCNKKHVDSLLDCIKTVGSAINGQSWRNELTRGV